MYGFSPIWGALLLPEVENIAKKSDTIQSRLAWMDTLRGFAAIWVVLYHVNSTEQFSSTPYQIFVHTGWFSIIIFFVISGVSIQSAAQRVKSAFIYTWHRFWRIYPPYIASVGLVAVIILARKMSFGENDFIILPRGVGGWVANIFLLMRPVTDYTAVNWVYWSLAYEVVFYALLGFGVGIKALKWPILFGASLAACLLGPHPPRIVFFLNFWSFFALGAAVAEWRAKPGPLPLLLLALCVVDFTRNHSFGSVLTAALTAASCWACMTSAGAWLNREKFFAWVGQWSYSLYLIHVPIGCWIAGRVVIAVFGQGFRQRSFLQHLLVDVGLVFVSCIAAVVFWILVERPSMAMMRLKTKN